MTSNTGPRNARIRAALFQYLDQVPIGSEVNVRDLADSIPRRKGSDVLPMQVSNMLKERADFVTGPRQHGAWVRIAVPEQSGKQGSVPA